MENTVLFTILKALPDPRNPQGKRHLLTDILIISVLAMLCGCDDADDIVLWAETREEWLKTILLLPHGIPSSSTFLRVFALLEPNEFEKCFTQWVTAVSKTLSGVVPIDGKTLRRSFDKGAQKMPVHMVSAWSVANGMTLGQVATEEKSNEITAIPKLIETLHLKGCIVTIDAMGCQQKIVTKIQEKEADYVIALKGNQSDLLNDVKFYLDSAIDGEATDEKLFQYKETDSGHGRIETRHVVSAPIGWYHNSLAWEGIQSCIAVTSERDSGSKKTSERRYYISSLDPSRVRKIHSAIRDHWGIENKLHWSLDVTFGEDQSRIRHKNAAENFSRLRRICLNLLKRKQPDVRKRIVSIKGRRKCAGWNNDYLLSLLTL